MRKWWRRWKQLNRIANTVLIIENLTHDEIVGPISLEELYIISVFGGHSAMDIPAGYVRVFPPERPRDGTAPMDTGKQS